jgi:hypothetical protein
VDHIPDPLLLRKSGSAGNRTQTSGSVARNSNHWTTEAVIISFYMHIYIYIYIFMLLKLILVTKFVILYNM